jgi:alkanesulfonate monooxygenase SsuD/methylene tetrahydromethanopterin reductase-like flavin-dependent oxidoreductase (luciferase family)
MRIGVVILPEYRWWAAAPVWHAAEELGFDHAWTYDHIAWRSLVDGPWFSAVPTLTAAAMTTSRIRLGMMVASPNFREPASFARDLLALDDISDGRFSLGIGSGGLGYDTEVFGAPELPPKQRMARFAEFTELLDSLLTKPRTDFDGEYYRVVQARSAPGCVQSPRLPFVVAANGPKGMALAAKFGQGWVTTGRGFRADGGFDAWWETVRAARQRFGEALEAQGRAPDSVQTFLQSDASPVTSFSSADFFDELHGRACEAGFTDLIAPWPRSEGIYRADEGVVEAVAGRHLSGRG